MPERAHGLQNLEYLLASPLQKVFADPWSKLPPLESRKRERETQIKEKEIITVINSKGSWQKFRGGAKCSVYLDLSADFIIFQNLPNDTLQMCAFYCMENMPPKLPGSEHSSLSHKLPVALHVTSTKTQRPFSVPQVPVRPPTHAAHLVTTFSPPCFTLLQLHQPPWCCWKIPVTLLHLSLFTGSSLCLDTPGFTSFTSFKSLFNCHLLNKS